ncbi:MAG: SDR family NAD-dependent epimerase/dehydratase, partial [Bacteroidota bacterium]
EGIWRLLHSDEVEPVNLGSTDEISIADFAREIIAVTQSESTISHEPLPEDDPQIRRPDITKAKDVLDWSPQIGRTDGLHRTIPDFRNRLDL